METVETDAMVEYVCVDEFKIGLSDEDEIQNLAYLLVFGSPEQIEFGDVLYNKIKEYKNEN